MLPSAAGSTSEQSVHVPLRFFSPDLQGTGEFGYGGSTLPRAEEALGGF